MLRCYLLEFHFDERERETREKRLCSVNECGIDGKKFPNVGIFNKFLLLLPSYLLRLESSQYKQSRERDICKYAKNKPLERQKMHIVIADKRVLSDKGKITNSNYNIKCIL